MKAAKFFFQNFEKIFCAFILASMVIICTLQVVMRYVFMFTFAWTEELARYLFVWLVFVAGSLAYQEKAHVRIDVLLRVFPKKSRKYVKKFGTLVAIAFLAFAAYLGAKYTVSFYQQGQISLGLKMPMAFVYAAIPVGFCLMTIRNIISLLAPLEDDDDIPSDAIELLESMEIPAASEDDAQNTMTDKEVEPDA